MNRVPDILATSVPLLGGRESRRMRLRTQAQYGFPMNAVDGRRQTNLSGTSFKHDKIEGTA
jgi:hypothetical protein